MGTVFVEIADECLYVVFQSLHRPIPQGTLDWGDTPSDLAALGHLPLWGRQGLAPSLRGLSALADWGSDLSLGATTICPRALPVFP